MKPIKRSDLFWGLLLVLGGLVLLAWNQGWVPAIASNTWVPIFAGLSVILLLGYFVSGWRNWGLLFPAAVCAGLAAAVALGEADQGPLAGTAVLLSISLPFWVALLAGRGANLWALIPAWALTAVGLIVLLAERVRDDVFVSAILYAIAMPFLILALLRRDQRWALIPAYVLAAIGTVFLLTGDSGDWFVSFILWAIGLPFLALFLWRRENVWALIPAYVLGVIGLFMLLANRIVGAGWVSLLLVAIGLPFLVTFLLNRRHWWALIPAGALFSAGATMVVAAFLVVDANLDRYLGGIGLAGMALTFGLVFLAQPREETHWAIYPSVILAAAAMVVLLFGLQTETISAVALIGVGLWLLARRGLAAGKF